MAGIAIDSSPQPQVIGQTTTDGLIVNFISTPSGSALERWIAQADFDADGGKALLDSLSSAVESILGEGLATGAVGVQTIDASGFLADNVDFTVTYVPPPPSIGSLSASVRIPITTLTADTQFGSFIQGGDPATVILDTYNKLKALAGG